MTDPRAIPVAVALAIATLLACFAAGYALAAHLYDRLRSTP